MASEALFLGIGIVVGIGVVVLWAAVRAGSVEDREMERLHQEREQEKEVER